MNNISAVESPSVASFSKATGGIQRREASGDNVINALYICVLSASGVDKVLIWTRGCSVAISVPDESQIILTSFICILRVPPSLMSLSSFSMSTIFINAPLLWVWSLYRSHVRFAVGIAPVA